MQERRRLEGWSRSFRGILTLWFVYLFTPFGALIDNAHGQDETLPVAKDAQEEEIDQDSLQETKDQIEAYKERLRQIDKKILELEVDNAQIGSTKPWPPLDPELPTDEWLRAIQSAQTPSIAELVNGLEKVGVRLVRTKTLVPTLGGDKGWLEVLIGAVHQNGLQTDPNANVRLRYSVILGGGTVTTTRGGKPIGTYGAYSLRTDVSLVLPARVLRGDAIYHADAEIAHVSAITMLPAEPNAAFLAQHLKTVTSQFFAKARADQRKPSQANPWTSSQLVGDPEVSQAYKTRFDQSFRKRRSELDAGLYTLGGFGAVQAKATHPGGIPKMEPILKANALNERWVHFLGEAGIPFGVGSAPTLRHDWILSRFPQEGPLKGAVACASRTAVLETDCLGVLNGQFVRFAGMSWVDRSETKLALAGNEHDPLWQNLNQSMRNVIAQVNTGRSVRLLAPHADTPAIAAALKRCKRADVPDVVVEQLANRIARILEGEPLITPQIRSRWILDDGGKPYYNLAAVGDARRADLIPRSAQEAVGRAINRVQYEDPIALYAFDRPFSYSKDGDYVKLPEEFAQRFPYPRATGGGSLYQERVVDGWKAAGELARYYAKDHKAALGALSSYRKILQESQVLIVSYHDATAGPDAAGSIYFFWYRSAPSDWKQRLPTLPQGQGLNRIGPPCELAPDHLAEAKRMLRLYQEDLAR